MDVLITATGFKPITFIPIGYVENDFDSSGQWEQMRKSESRIVLDPHLVEGLNGMAPGQKVMVLFQFNRSHDYDLLQHPRGDTGRSKQGVFTLRSPRRPNPIGVTVVEIVAIHENILTVFGLDAFNGTPVIDLKPA